LPQLKKDLPDVEFFKIKYGWKWFEIGNMFSHWNVSKFRMKFEVKFKEDLGFEFG
jgi:hypothetical protein